MPPGRKILGLDIARTIAIALAMLNHSFIATNVWKDFFEPKPQIAFVVRLATPMFIILFGALLEVVYRNRERRDGLQSVTARLFERALLCWLLYALTLIPLLWTGRTSVTSAVFGALLAGKIPLSDILRYYTILFFLAPLLLFARNRWGLLPLLAASTAFLLLHPVLVLLPAPPPDFAHYAPARLADLLLGLGDAVAGPSVLHSLFFVAVGMLIGWLLGEDRSPDVSVREGVTRRFLLLGASLSFGAFATFFMGPEEVTTETAAGMVLRNANHPFYFFCGALGTTVIVALCRFVRADGPGLRYATFLGRRSLFTFAAGNAFLILVTQDYGAAIPHRLLLSGLFFLTVVGLAMLYDIIMQPGAATSRIRLVRTASRGWQAMTAPVNRLLRAGAAKLTALVSWAPIFPQPEVQKS